MLVSAKDIVKFHNDKCILEGVSFSIEEQDKIALVGVNGTGKSTFLNIVAGIENCEGKIIRKNGLRISYLSQNTDFDDNLTVMNQVKLLSDNKSEEYEIKSALSQFGISDYDVLINTLSGGQRKRVALAAAILKECDLFILDEPTNHLDYEMIEYLEKFLKKFNKAVLMVTHDRYFLERIVNRIFEIDRTKLYEYQANYSKYLEEKLKREEIALANQRKRESFLRKELEWVRAGVQARGTKSRDRLERFETLSNIEKINEQKQVDMVSVYSRLGRKTIEIIDLEMSYEDRILFSNFNYQLKRFERLGIIGINGCGKSTLLKIIAKQIQPSKGEVIYGDTIRIGYYAQDNEELDEDQRVIDYIKEVSDNLVTEQGRFSAKMMLERFLFDENLQYARIKTLSGGEKRRLYLLKILMEAPNVLLLDEPTNDLDIATLEILEDYLDDFKGIVIIVSHDRYLLDRLCEGVLVFCDGSLIYKVGGYHEALVNKEKTKKEESAKERYKQQNKEARINRPSLNSKDKRDLETLEDVISGLENQIRELDERMGMTSDFEEIQKLSIQRDKLEEEVSVKSERYLTLLEIKEQIEKYNQK